MENPALGGVSECRTGKIDVSEFTRKSHDPQAATRAIEAGRVYLPHPADLAFILRRRLGLPERIWLAISSLLALPPDTAEELAEAALHDLRADRDGPVEAEAERMRRQWLRHCAERRHRSPLLTPAEKRRAAKIPDFDDPDFLVKLGAGTGDRRARLASAWNGASARDRRDLISRATARAS